MSIDIERIKHVAHLARITLTPEEEAHFEKDLSSVLAFVAELGTLDTTKVAPMTGGTTQNTIMRKDASISSALENSAGILIQNSPSHEKNFIKVKPIF